MRWLVILLCLLWSATAGAEPPVLVGPTDLHSTPDGACALWVDANENGKRDKAERLQESSSDIPSIPPTEATSQTVDGLTTSTRIWRRPATEDDYIEFEEGRPVEERHTEVHDAAGRLVAESYEHSMGASDGYEIAFEYDADGRLTSSEQSGPGNSSVWTSYEYGADGYLVRVVSRTNLGAYYNGGSDIRVVREGNVVVRLVRDSFGETSCENPDEEPQVRTLCRQKGMERSDFVETSRTPREIVATFEYDGNLRVVAKREVGFREYSGYFATTTRYSYDCK